MAIHRAAPLPSSRTRPFAARSRICRPLEGHHKLLDAWLLALCTGCGDTTKVTVLERVHVRSIRPELLDRMHADDPVLAGELLQDGVVRRRNHIALDWTGAWRLDTGGADHLDREVAEVAVRFEAPSPSVRSV